ncbi:MAG: nuclear transport factor 2 family protein [Deltaproteobacteria bacterium]|nr:nuclear transport factor 2 family protein [Deltaproteobacteria bacterium]
MDLIELERRITRIEDIEAIKQLKARYCEICDDGHDPDRVTRIFAEDGAWRSGPDKAEGHAAIRELFLGFQRRISYSQHMVMNPIIEVDGTEAHAVWYFFGCFTFRENNEARWLAARYHEDYVKLDGTWKIKRLRVRGPAMNARYDEGWAPTGS